MNLLFDTDVIIWLLRGNLSAQKMISEVDSPAISAITYMELVQGILNKKEFIQLRQLIVGWDFKLFYVSQEIHMKAIGLVEELYLSDALKIPDALIAATALFNGLTLVTGNVKHFQKIPPLQLKKFTP